MVEGNATPPSTHRRNGRDFETLHYELAAQVVALGDKLKDTNNNLTAIAVEMRQPRPIQWGMIASICGTLAALFLSIGGLVHANISQRIDDNKATIENHEKMMVTRLTELEARIVKKDDTLMPRVEVESSVNLLRETAKRLEEVQVTQQRMQQEFNVSKAEFNATVTALQSRMTKNEFYIEDARKGEVLNARISQLYELYRQLSQQQLQLHGIFDRGLPPGQLSGKP